MIHVIDLIKQITYITEATEAETTGHMTHMSDWKLYGNSMEDLEHAEAMHRFMNGQETEGHSVSWKIDGETSLTFGKKHDGRHFVAYKSAKNHFHTPEEIEAAGVPWAEAGKRLLKYVTEMNIKPGHVFQGDLLWTNRDKEIHDGTHIKPNTIPYKPTHHDVGIAVHSQYEMDHAGNLNRTTNAPDVSQIQHEKVFAPDLQIKPGQVMLTRERNKAVGESLSKARSLMTPEVQEYVNSLATNKNMQKFIQEYANEVVATTGKRDVESLKTYLHKPIMGTRTSYGYMEKATQRNKSEKSRAGLVKEIEDHINQHGDKLSAMFQSMQHVADAKHHMLDQFKAHGHTAPIQVHGGGEHEGVVSAFAKKKPGMISGIIGRLAKLTREGISGFSGRNRRRGVERGFTKERELPHPEVPFVDHTEPIKEEMAVGTGAGLAGLGGPKDVAVPVEAQKRYTRSGPMRRKRRIVESFFKNLIKEDVPNKDMGQFYQTMVDTQSDPNFQKSVENINARRWNPLNQWKNFSNLVHGAPEKLPTTQVPVWRSQGGGSALNTYGVAGADLSHRGGAQGVSSHPQTKTGEVKPTTVGFDPQVIANNQGPAPGILSASDTQKELSKTAAHEIGHQEQDRRTDLDPDYKKWIESEMDKIKNAKGTPEQFQTYHQSGVETSARIHGAVGAAATTTAQTGRPPSFSEFAKEADLPANDRNAMERSKKTYGRVVGSWQEKTGQRFNTQATSGAKSVGGAALKGLGVVGAVTDPVGTAAQTAADAVGGKVFGALGSAAGAALFINQSAGDPEGDIVANMTPEQTKEYNERKRQEMLARQEQERRQKETDRTNAPIRNPQMGGPINKPKM